VDPDSDAHTEVFRMRIRKFFGLQDPDQDLSINKQKIEKNFDFNFL
jgi:hypothetical protein